MAFTTNKKLSAQAAASASGTWGAGGTTGVDLNTGVIGPLDTILAGISTITTTSGTYSLTFTSGGGGDVNNAMWSFTATLLGDLTVSPTAGDATTYLNGFYLWSNTTAGAHTVTLTTANGSVVLPQGRRGVLYVSTAANIAPLIVAIVGSTLADSLPTGTSLLFYNSAAPSGWTTSATNDYAVKIASTGGVSSGSVAYSTLFGRTATDGYTLQVADIPSHSHTVTPVYNTSIVNSGAGGGSLGGLTTITSGLTGGGGSHSHGIDMRVLTLAFVLGTRN